MSTGFMTSTVSTVQAQAVLLEEIVVTARRREEALKDVPVAISVLSNELFEEANFLDHYDMYAEIPGVDYRQSKDRIGASPSIRGVSTTSQNILQQKTGNFIDGVPVLGNTAFIQFVGLERVEVLRGPQSAAFGRSTFSGAFNYVTRDPGEETEIEATISSSDLQRDRVNLGLSGPITDTLGYTLDYYTEDLRGPDWWKATDGTWLGGTETDYISAKLKWAPSDKFDLEVRLSKMEANDRTSLDYVATAGEVLACSNFNLTDKKKNHYLDGVANCDFLSVQQSIGRNFDLNAPHPTNGQTAAPYAVGTDGYNTLKSYSTLNPGVRVDNERIQMEFNYNLDNGQTIQFQAAKVEETGIRWHDQDGFDNPCTMKSLGKLKEKHCVAGASPRYHDEKYYDVRWISSADSALRWVVGASSYDFYRNDLSYKQYAAIIDPALATAIGKTPVANRAQNRDAKTIGYYANLTYDLSDRTSLSTEFRQQTDEGITREPLSGYVIPLKTDAFSPRVSLTHQLNDDVTLYLQGAKGTNPATANPTFADTTRIASLAAAKAAGHITYDHTTFREADEETLTSYEIGLKGQAFDNQLAYNVALYSSKWENMIMNRGLDWSGFTGDSYDEEYTQSGQIYTNQGSADMKGLEIDFVLALNDYWTIRSGFAWMDNTYTDTCHEEPVTDYGVTADKTVAADGVLSDCVDISGNALEAHHTRKGSISATYMAPLGNSGWDVRARLASRYSGQRYLDVMNWAIMPEIWTQSATLSFMSDNWDVTLYGNNLTNETQPLYINMYYKDRLPVVSGKDRVYQITPRMPREVGAHITYRF
tara:strand:- start:40800 stop:43250 length:2451 start_codon:yes stop_codon:yes gene_type:complete